MAHQHGHHHAHHHSHHHHRGLVIALALAVVGAGVAIGVMALATNDTDEPVHDDIASASGLVAAPSDGTDGSVPLVSVDLRDFPRGATVDFTPKGADCAASLQDAHATGDGDRSSVEVKLYGEIRCSPYRVSWATKVTEGSQRSDFTIVLQGDSGSLQTECVGVQRFECSAGSGVPYIVIFYR
jgi:hypothetical protein